MLFNKRKEKKITSAVWHWLLWPSNYAEVTETTITKQSSTEVVSMQTLKDQSTSFHANQNNNKKSYINNEQTKSLKYLYSKSDYDKNTQQWNISQPKESGIKSKSVKHKNSTFVHNLRSQEQEFIFWHHSVSILIHVRDKLQTQNIWVLHNQKKNKEEMLRWLTFK